MRRCSPEFSSNKFKLAEEPKIEDSHLHDSAKGGSRVLHQFFHVEIHPRVGVLHDRERFSPLLPVDKPLSLSPSATDLHILLLCALYFQSIINVACLRRVATYCRMRTQTRSLLKRFLHGTDETLCTYIQFISNFYITLNFSNFIVRESC